MQPVLIPNPILNAPFEEPKEHFRFDDNNRITSEVAKGRRPSSYWLPVPTPKRKADPTLFDEVAASEKKAESSHVNRLRERVGEWRSEKYPETTETTRLLLDYWTDPNRGHRLFFCQIEALETLIFIHEVAMQGKLGQGWVKEYLKTAADTAGTPLLRMACKMATGSGKTVVMAMLIAWQTLNKRQRPNDNRFTDSFLIVTPGITIKDRLRVLLPQDEGNYYRQMDLVPFEHRQDLGTARIVVTNFHAFKPKEKGDAGGLTKRILTANNPGAFTETPEEMVNRICKEFRPNQQIIAINDEAHHCYRRRIVDEAAAAGEKLTTEEKKEVKDRDEEARLWINGLEAVQKKLGIKAVFDLSATPFYLKGSGYPEGTLFPWVVSDFSLIDAIESGIVKIPRVPVSDNAMVGEMPKYRNLWYYIREGLPKKGRGSEDHAGPPVLPQELQGALESLYGHYQSEYEEWEGDEEGRANGRTPPVFIVVCNNTSVSKLMYDFIAGFETEHQHPDGAPIVAPGRLAIFNNADNKRWLARPNTILVDSRQFESEEGMSADFKKLAAHLIDDFKAEVRTRFPGRDVEALTDSDLMREVMNTVGKAGKLGENIKCVVSVSMLTEGWDANTVTHILGVRAFGTQLLCEQVVGRGLRRTSYALNDKGHFDPEYADVYGVPFAFLPVAGVPDAKAERKPARKPGRVQAMPDRLIDRPWLEIVFPRVLGYRYEALPEVLTPQFDPSCRVILTTQDIPTRTENAPIAGETAVLTLEEAKALRPQTVAFKLATHLQQHHFKQQVHLFPQLLAIVRQWMDAGYVDYGDETFPGLLCFAQKANEAAEKLKRAIITGSGGQQRLRAELNPTDRTGSTVGVGYDTLKKTWTTDPKKCHLNLVPDDSGWEAALVEKIERMDEVRAYVKNQNLGFRVPYTFEGRPASYYPDYILKVNDGHGMDDLLNLIVEISGQDLKEKEAKVETAKTLWVPAVNNETAFGRWAFLEIDNPAKAMQTIRQFLATEEPKP